MTESTYQTWLRAEKAWIGGYCKKMLHGTLFKTIPVTLLGLAVLMGLMGLVGGGGVEAVLTGAVGGATASLIVCLFFPFGSADCSAPQPLHPHGGGQREGPGYGRDVKGAAWPGDAGGAAVG